MYITYTKDICQTLLSYMTSNSLAYSRDLHFPRNKPYICYNTSPVITSNLEWAISRDKRSFVAMKGIAATTTASVTRAV